MIVISDTDSIFIKDRLPDFEIGNDLGQMKDELNGQVINKAIFLGIKEYGYEYIDIYGYRINKSVFAALSRDSISLS